jgi:aldehyde dehydrogenase (NAD+)
MSNIASIHGATGATSDVQALKRVFNLQRPAALKLRASTVDQRLEKLERLRQTILNHKDEIIDAAQRDFKRPEVEVLFTELMPVLSDIGDTKKRLRKWLKPRRARMTSTLIGTQAWSRYEPRGRCLIISPWNYPVNLTLGPLVPAIASGNTVIIKASEVSPAFSTVLVKIIRSVFDESEVAIFEGDASVATALLDLPFDHIFFTGAPNIGKVVMTAAARNLSSVTLELGGKSPTIIDETADLDLATSTIGWAKFINSGQTCIAPDHIYVHSSVKARVIELFKSKFDAWYGAGELAKQSSLTRIINERHTRRISALIDDAKHRGANILYGGVVDPAERFVSPTMITDIPHDAQIMQEEIFGPLLPIIEYRTINDVIDRINEDPKPLGLYIWSRNQRTIDSIVDNTSAGGTCINHVAAHFLHHDLPFGGVNNSGIGSYHGEWGIRAFSHERAFVRTRINTVSWLFPPYGEKVRRLLHFLLRYL